ncbi:MAG: deoxynucleoside kinase [Bacteroidales bacterium]|nr:deoxynucleoside kinase [Bacteroidales bacterium]
MNYKFIVIEGNIGAGKTTLANLLAERYNGRLILEQFADNPFLPKFYKEPEKYSFQLELSFMVDRFHQFNNSLINLDLFKQFTIADYHLMKSLIFAQTTLKEEEYKLYRKIFNMLYPSLPKPDLYIYLYSHPKKLIQNIAKRGREYEKNITEDYLNKIQKNYFDFFKTQEGTKFVIVDTNKLDFVENTEDMNWLEKTIFEKDFKIGINRVFSQNKNVKM